MPMARKLPPIMGSYGIGIERILSAAIELFHDQDGMILPAAIAPFQVVITPANNSDSSQMEAAREIYESCLALGLDALLDDRDERPGVKFKDADLIGVPCRIVLRQEAHQRSGGSGGPQDPRCHRCPAGRCRAYGGRAFEVGHALACRSVTHRRGAEEAELTQSFLKCADLSASAPQRLRTGHDLRTQRRQRDVAELAGLGGMRTALGRIHRGDAEEAELMQRFSRCADLSASAPLLAKQLADCGAAEARRTYRQKLRVISASSASLR